MFDVRYQYALNTTNNGEQPISKNILSNFRCAIYEYELEHKVDLIKLEVESLAKHFKKFLHLDDKVMRMDSLMISSSCRRLSRLELMFSVVDRCIKAIAKVDQNLIPEELSIYLKEGYRNDIIYRSRDIELKNKLRGVTSDAVRLYYLDIPEEVKQLQEYQLLLRMLEEQTKQGEKGIDIKPSTEISPESIQNPTDPDATYRRKGDEGYVGYVGNVIESFDDDNRIITTYDIHQNTYSDQIFAKDVIEQIDNEGNKTLIVDGGFYSNDNASLAEGKNIIMVPTDIVGKKPEEGMIGYDKFNIGETSHIVKSCPAGRVPIQESEYIYNQNLGCNVYRGYFDKEICSQCLLKDIVWLKRCNEEINLRCLRKHCTDIR